MKNLKKMMDYIMEYVCVILFAFMTIVGTYQIVTRYVFNSPSTKSEELLTYSFTWMALLAASYVFGKRDHMRMAFFAEKFSPQIQYILSLAGEVITIVFSAAVLIYGGISITKLTMTQQSASLGIPMGYIYCIIPVCGIITLLYNLINIFELSQNMKNGEASK